MSCESCLFRFGDFVCLRGSLESPCSCFVDREEVEAYVRGEELKRADLDIREKKSKGHTLPQKKRNFCG